jgi:hypothetical protein
MLIEALVDLQRATRQHALEYRSVRDRRCENLKSTVLKLILEISVCMGMWTGLV